MCKLQQRRRGGAYLENQPSLWVGQYFSEEDLKLAVWVEVQRESPQQVHEREESRVCRRGRETPCDVFLLWLFFPFPFKFGCTNMERRKEGMKKKTNIFSVGYLLDAFHTINDFLNPIYVLWDTFCQHLKNKKIEAYKWLAQSSIASRWQSHVFNPVQVWAKLLNP